MGLDIFEITINNNSSQNKFIDTKNIWLVDNLGNQQQMLDVGHFERLYLSAQEKHTGSCRYRKICIAGKFL